jgi:molecular chaperone IbpA
MFDPHLRPQLKELTIGFEDIFERFNNLFEHGMGSSLKRIYKDSYPPYNIREMSKHKYHIEMAVAGFSKKDIKVEYADNVLTIQSISENKKDQTTLEQGYVPEYQGDHPKYYKRGLATRSFLKRFTLHDDVEVKDATLRDGLLKVVLEKILPEGKKPKKITVK